MKNNKQFTSALATARGRGSSKEGVSHWYWQRLTAVILIPLALWFVFSLVNLSQIDEIGRLHDWFASPFNTILSILLFGALFYHAKLGVQVVIEDYVHCACIKTVALIGIKLAFLIAGIVSILSIIKLHLFAV